MTEREKKLLSKQLMSVAKDLLEKEDSEMLTIAANAADVLVNLSSDSDVVRMADESTFDALSSVYLRLGAKTVRFYEGANERLGVLAEENEFLHLQKEIEARRNALNEYTRQIQENSPAKLAELQEALDEVEKQFFRLEGEKKRIEEKLDQYSDDRREKIEAEINRLELEYDEKRPAYIEADKKLQEVTKALEEIPEETKKLLDAYDRKATLLGRLETAEKDCCEEKQKELDHQIKNLEPIVKDKEKAMGGLKERYDELVSMAEDYDQKSENSANTLIAWLNDHFEELRKWAQSQQDELQELKKVSDTLAKNLVECEKLCEGLKEWRDAATTPLETMSNLVSEHYGKHEAKSLRESLDPNKLEIVQKNKKVAANAIEQLEEVLKMCIEVDKKDVTSIKKKSGY